MKQEVAQLMKDEGFRGYPYRCTQGFLTVGHGFNIEPGYIHSIVHAMLQGVEYPISQEYSTRILGQLVKNIWDVVQWEYPDQPVEVKRILTNMQYQLGAIGVARFRKMHAALKVQDYGTAAKEMLDSVWARQTPNRARRLAERMAKV